MECNQELTPGSQEVSHSEPSIELPPNNDVTPPVPGSVYLFGDGQIRFPNFLWNLGGHGILVNPLSKDVPEFLLSVEATLLYILDQAVKNGGKGLNFCTPIPGVQRDLKV